MGKLYELIQQYCPNGVKYKALSEIAPSKRGKRVVKSELSDSKGYPVYQNSLTPLGYYDKTNCKSGTTFIIAAGAAGEIGYSNEDFWAADDCFYFVCPDCLNNRYLYHVLLSQYGKLKNFVRHGAVPRISRAHVDSVIIPLPPLLVQEKIAQTLDAFTELENELNAELELRQKQYEYYRDNLLSLNDYNGETETVALGGENGLCTIVRGASPRPIKNFITEDSINGVHWIKIGDVDTNAKYIEATKEYITKDGAKHSRFVKRGDFILSNSMSFGRPYILKIDGCIHDGWLALSGFEDRVLPDYLYHALMSSDLQHEMKNKAADGGCVSNLNSEIVSNIFITIPKSLEDQQKIVDMLDKFDILTTDTSKGIPAEIKMRHQQYEYYRNKLLAFESKVGD